MVTPSMTIRYGEAFRGSSDEQTEDDKIRTLLSRTMMVNFNIDNVRPVRSDHYFCVGSVFVFNPDAVGSIRYGDRSGSLEWRRNYNNV